MSHTPASGTNPFAGANFLNGYAPTVLGKTNQLERILGDSEGSIDLGQLPEFRDLKREVESLKDTLAAHRECIQQMAEEIDRLKQNNSGQRVNQTTGYWEERCY